MPAGDLSTNCWWVAAVSFGEGWHNSHHAFPYSARHGLEWWELDPTWYLICILKALGLVWDVQVCTTYVDSALQSMALMVITDAASGITL
jgi:fatty-acid desaturase